MVEISSWAWQSLGYVGYFTPWHDREDRIKLLEAKRDRILQWLDFLQRIDVEPESYLRLMSVLSTYTRFEFPLSLVGQRNHWTWFEKFRVFCGSKERVKEVSVFIRRLAELQIEHSQKAYIKTHRAINDDETGAPHLAIYHTVRNKMDEVVAGGGDPLTWMEEKFNRMRDSMEVIYPINILSTSRFDPDPKEVVEIENDPWKEIKRFLGLSPRCEFPDNCLPKGWTVSSDDFDDTKKIVSITKDGYYYYEDGTQRGGKRHYGGNRYLLIYATPDNFLEFKNTWKDPKLLAARPTWEEYRRYGLYPGLWDESGAALSSYVRDIKWRKG